MSERLSPIEVEILWKRAISAVDEAVTALVKTSYSSVIRDFHDYACAVFDSEGRMIAQSTHSTPGLLGILPFTIPNFLKHKVIDELEPGDVLVTNDPWLASGHLIDITVATPIFRNDRICGYALCVVHHLNVGGRLTTLASRDIYEEGLKLPITRLYKAGEPVEAVFDIIRANVREPDKVIGDIRAQVSANHAAAQKLINMMEVSGLDALEPLSEEIITRSERSMRNAIAALPDGEYTQHLDLTELADLKEPVHLELTVRIAGDEIHLDYSGSSPQVFRAINVTLNMTRSYSVYPIKCILDPTVPNNEGCLRPIKITAPEGSVLNAKFPAATWGRTIVAHMLPELIIRAMAKVTPDSVVAPSGATPLWFGNFAGRYKDGRTFYVISCFNGGMGARAGRDGLSTICFPANVASVPMEVVESDAAIRVTHKKLAPGSFGAGKFRGGAGQLIGFEVPSDMTELDGPVLVSIRGGRLGVPISGLFGGKDGCAVNARLNGAPVPLGTAFELYPGDRIEFLVPGGAGYGDPLDRDEDLVAEDVRNGFISADEAFQTYAVVFNPLTGQGRRERKAELRVGT